MNTVLELAKLKYVKRRQLNIKIALLQWEIGPNQLGQTSMKLWNMAEETLTKLFSINAAS